MVFAEQEPGNGGFNDQYDDLGVKSATGGWHLVFVLAAIMEFRGIGSVRAQARCGSGSWPRVEPSIK
jgi:hypothetical protein